MSDSMPHSKTDPFEEINNLQKKLKRSSQIKEVLDKHSIVIITDKQGIITYVNERFCELSHYSKQELLGQNANVVNSSYHTASFWLNLWQTITQGKEWQGEIRNKAKDGSHFWVDMVITPLVDEQGKVEEYIAIRKDISQSKQIEAQMRFDAYILSQVNDAVVGLDTAYKVNYWNQGAARQYGLATEQVIGKPLSEVYTSLWINPGDEAIAMQALAQNGNCKVEIIHRLKNGVELYVEATTQVMFNEQGENTGLLALIRDITKRKKAEQVLHTTLQELEKKNYELDNYVYKVSHDLRAPLTSMQGLLNLIKLESSLEVKQQYLTLIESRVSKLDEYIQSILYHAKMVNAAIEITSIDIEKIIQECFEELKHFNNWHRVKLTVQIEGNSSFCNDAFRLTVILKNIITNAVKYMNVEAAQSYLHFGIEIKAANILIKVADNGIGIEEEYIDKIFNMFFRATTSSQGSGLGLYIVKQAIEKLNGSIRVESTRGKGTVFKIELPNFSLQ